MKGRFYRSILLILTIVCFLSIFTVVSFAYFSSDLRIKGYTNIKIELLFDHYEESALEEYQSGFENLTEEDKVWGHKGNPYLISGIRHIYNLSVLQNNGYFYKNFIESNFDENGVLVGNTDFSDGYEVPYFVISNPDGAPVVIDASTRVIKPVGNDQYPFIGSVVGASSSESPVGFSASGKDLTTTTSAIHGVTVQTTKSSIDYGFFGKISYLGIEPVIDESLGMQTFEGYVSNISNILFSDVKVKVESSVWEDIMDYVLNHLFYKKTFGVTEEVDPCETHHVGIIAGHVEYAKMSALSVYYSSEDILAIDLQDAGRDGDNNPFNYASATGHIGFMYSLNPVVEGGTITVGSGIDSADISYGFQGGGGIASGVLPGYIRADQIDELYGYYAVETNGETEYVPAEGKLHLIKAYDQTGLKLVQEVKNSNSTNYYYTDGVFTFALSGGQNPDTSNPDALDTIEDIWEGNVDTIELSSNGWGVGQKGEQLFYYKNLEKVTSFDQLNTNDEYYIGRFSDDGAFSFMDLTSSGSSVPARTAKGTLRDGTLGLQYKSIPDRTSDEQYTIKISNIGAKQNASGASVPTFTFTSSKSGYSLGITRQWFIIYIYGITCSEDGKNGNADYDLVLSVNADGAWTFQRLDVNDNSDSYQGIGFSGSTFSTDWWGGSNSVPIYIYKVTGNTDNVNEVPYTYIPNDTSATKLPANQYVFYPQVEATGDATKTTTSYMIKSLEDLGWGNSEGDKIWKLDENGNPVINKMFDIKQSVDWSLALNLGNWGVNLGEGGGTVLAPVGSGSYQKQVYIPTGTIAFCINKVPVGGAKIRVIVKVPQSDGLRSLGMNSDSNSGDHYLGIWQGKEKQSNSWFSYSSFNINDAYKKVELPRSQSWIDGTSNSHYVNSNGASTANEYLDVTYNGQNYTTMLQGGHYLMAYEFVVDNEGLYILAATDVRMQIAYCSVDGVASSGRDGTGGSPLGNIDFVYDNGDKVLLVTDGGTGENGEEDPSQYYYESFVLVHFSNIDDNGNLHSINSEKLSIYRWAGGEGEVKTNIDVDFISGYCSNDCEHVLCSPIKSITDNITVNRTKKE
jgi:hypothetical protein